MSINPQRLTIRLVFVAVALCGVILSTISAHAVSAGAARPESKLIVSGSATLFPLMTDVAQRFEHLHPGVKIELRSSGSGKGIAEVRAGTCDIGMLSRAPFANERDLFGYPIARDGLAVVVHRENPIKGVTTTQLTGILTGQLVNWKQLGGHDAPIRLAWRTQGHGSVELILEKLNLRREQVVPHTIVRTNEQGIALIAKDPHAVTLASVAEAELSAQAGVGVKLLAFNGSPASTRTIQNHNYMLSRPMTLVTRHLPQGLQKQFIDYALSPEVVDLQVKYGFVPYKD